MPKSLAKQRMEPDHGNGRVVGEAHADSRNARGYILDGPEYLPIPDGGPVYAWATQPYDPPIGDSRNFG